MKRSSDSTARVYLNAVIPFFEWLEKDESQGGTVRRWDDSPEAIRQGVGDYLVERLKCKVRDHYAGFQLVSLTDGTQTTVRVFLSALKLFYRVMRAQDRYRYAHALVDGPSAVLAEVQDRIAGADSLPNMPEVSGVVHLKWTKAELVARLLSVENTHAVLQERWLEVTEEALSWRLRAERAESQVRRVKP
ncbi:MAG TPA: hypothetical protein VGF82_14960 [Terracidiphilus sp.]